MSDKFNEKQSVMNKEEVQRIIDERIARLVEKEKLLVASPTDGRSSSRKFKPCKRIRQFIKKLKEWVKTECS